MHEPLVNEPELGLAAGSNRPYAVARSLSSPHRRPRLRCAVPGLGGWSTAATYQQNALFGRYAVERRAPTLLVTAPVVRYNCAMGEVAGARRLSRAPEPSARERLLEAAERLFYSEGVHLVGVDFLTEQAGVAKWTLYNHFGSKDGLVEAYLERGFELRRRRAAEITAAHDSPRDQLLALFDDLTTLMGRRRFRGCIFLNAGIEAEGGERARTVIRHYRRWLVELLSGIAQAAGAENPETLGRQLALLYDGVAAAARLDDDRAAAARAARLAAQHLLDGDGSDRG
jgi:AcrR family transcriptional regulator